MIPSHCLIIFLLCPIVQQGNCDGVSKTLFDTGIANSTVNLSNDGTTETHYTTCKITTEEFVANAQATFTRVLTGSACNTQIMDERFEKLERSLNYRFDEIKELIVGLMVKDLNFSKPIINDERDLSSNVLVENQSKNGNGNGNENESENGNENILFISRHDEIQYFNNTIRDINKSKDHTGRRNVYTYYWRVSNILEKLLQWQTGRSERSSNFYVIDAGYAMYLRFTPKYFPDGTIFISVGLTSGRNDMKINWPFPLQIRVEILDVTMGNDGAKEDRSSRMWDPATVCSSYFWGRPGQMSFANGKSSDNPECVGLSLPRQLLTDCTVEQTVHRSSSLNGKYVLNDSLLVKLTVYL